MAVRTTAGTTISISATIPATFTSAAYDALAFTAIGEVTDLGEFGREYQLVTHSPIGTRGIVKKKGGFNEGSMTLQVGLDTKDAGQILCKSAVLSDNDYSFKVVTQSGDIYYFQAQVMSFKVGAVQVNAIASASLALELTTSATGIGIVEKLAP